MRLPRRLTFLSTVSATLTSIKTVTQAGTTTVFANAKREAGGSQLHELDDRALLDFAAIASIMGYNLAATSVSAACSCFSSSYTAATTTTTSTGTSTVTVAIAKATAIITTTIKGVTV